MSGYHTPPQFSSNAVDHRRQLAQAIGLLLQGKMNATASVTLNASATSTTLTDPRIGANTFVGFSPLTASAAAAQSALYVSAQQNGQATLSHASSAAADQTFRLLLIG